MKWFYDQLFVIQISIIINDTMDLTVKNQFAVAVSFCNNEIYIQIHLLDMVEFCHRKGKTIFNLVCKVFPD